MELLTTQTSHQPPFPNVSAAVINRVGLYQRNYFGPQPELSLFFKPWGQSGKLLWLKGPKH